MWLTAYLLIACGPKKTAVENVVPTTELSVSDNAPSETKGVRSVELLAQIVLNDEFEGFEKNTVMRFRRLTVESNGVVAQHEHQKRPGVAYILSGTIHEYRDGDGRECQQGSLAFEQSGVTHWWENNSSDDVVAVVVDIVQSETLPELNPYTVVNQAEEPPTENNGLTVNGLGTIELSQEFTTLSGKQLRVRHVDVAPTGVVAFHKHDSRPSFAYLISGQMVEHRDDRTEGITHTVGSVVAEHHGLGHWWENTSTESARFLVVDIVDVN
jgi:quercetin dioxygenase-like cupin family protein